VLVDRDLGNTVASLGECALTSLAQRILGAGENERLRKQFFSEEKNQKTFVF
jgi:hypothetical protein